MSPLAIVIYQVLRQHLLEYSPVIAYGELAAELRRAFPEHAAHQRSAKLHAALAEVSRACRAAGLPCLTAMVRRADTHLPSDGYFKVAHPRVRSDDGRAIAWMREHASVLVAYERFPPALPATPLRSITRSSRTRHIIAGARPEIPTKPRTRSPGSPSSPPR